MDNIKKIVIKLNLFIASVILVVFYIIVIPLGKIIFLIFSIFKNKNKETYWQTQDKQNMDLSSSY